MKASSGAGALLRGAPYVPVPDVARIGPYHRDVFGFEAEYAAGDPPSSRVALARLLRKVPADFGPVGDGEADEA